MKFRDLRGLRFGRWLVIERAPNHSTPTYSHVRWRCRCDCGTISEVFAGPLLRGKSNSCGCICREAGGDLFARFAQKYIVDHDTGCWVWCEKKDKLGYGSMSVHDKNIAGHRLAFELFRHPIPSGKFVCHHCDNPSCVNPDHLYVGTAADNSGDVVNRGRSAANKTRNFGAKNGNPKISARIVMEMRSLRQSGISTQELARRYKISRDNADRISAGKEWTWVSMPETKTLGGTAIPAEGIFVSPTPQRNGEHGGKTTHR